jgi:hypothetical protein
MKWVLKGRASKLDNMSSPQHFSFYLEHLPQPENQNKSKP